MNPVYSCPPEMMWSPSELKNTKKRQCNLCEKVCSEVFVRVYFDGKFDNYCSKECYDVRNEFLEYIENEK